MSRTVCGVVLVVLFGALLGWTATQNAIVYGTVYDASGNPMAGATVVLENPSLGLSRSATTGSDGTFNFAEVPPADGYELTASKDGRKLDVRRGISVNVGDERVILPPLRESASATGGAAGAPGPGARVEQAQVVHNETVSTSISGVITGEQLRSLPLYNRNFLVLGLLTPNVRDTQAGSELAGASFSISGTRPSANNFLLDGSDNVASSSNQAVPFQVNDAIQEFRVTSSGASSEYGRNLGGVVSVVTRRGGNAFHGSAFGYFASDALNADGPLSVYNGTTFDQAAAYAGSVTAVPLTVATLFGFAPLRYNNYVATAEANGFCTDSITNLTGGPANCVANGFGADTRFDPESILAADDLRKRPFDSKQFGVNAGGALIKNKWFVFGSYEATRIDNPAPVFERVPSSFDRTYNAYAARSVPGAVAYAFPSTSADYAIASNILSLYPAPTVVGVPDVLEFFQGEAPNDLKVHNFLLRTDYTQSAKNAWSVRYVAQVLDQLHDNTLPAQPNYPGNGSLRNVLNQNLNIAYSHTFSSSVVNELRVGFNRFRVEETPQDASFDATTLGLPGSSLPTIFLNGLDTQYSGAVPAVNGAFAIWSDIALMAPTLDYFFPFARLGAPVSSPSQHRDTTFFLADNVSVAVGRHTLRFGAEFRHLRNDVFDGAFSRGFIYSSNIGEFTSDSESCNEVCAILVGTSNAFIRPSFDFAQAQSTPFEGKFRSNAIAVFVHDTWRIHPRWTLNFGLRYEYFSPPEESGNRIWNFDPVAKGLVQQNSPGPVVDPYGNACPDLPTNYPSAPAFLATLGTPAGWACNPSGSGKAYRRDTNNFAPRAGLAWDVWGDSKTVVRFGIGWFYDQLPASSISSLLFNRPTTLSDPNALYGRFFGFFAGLPCNVGLSPCGVGNNVLTPAGQAAQFRTNPNPNSFFSVAAQPFAVYAIDTAHSDTPYTRQLSATIQQSITGKLNLEVGYVQTSGRRLPVIFNQNFGEETALVSSAFGPNVTAGNFVFFPIFTQTHQADSSFHSLMVRTRVAEWHGLRLGATYSLANSEDNAPNALFPVLPTTLNNFGVGYQRVGTGNPAILCLVGTAPAACSGPPLVFPSINFGTGAVTTTAAAPVLVSRYLIPQDSFNFLQDERGRSDFHTKHRFVMDYTWEVPTKDWPGWLQHWQVSGIFVAQSGQPFSVFAGPILGEVTQRADTAGAVSVHNDDPSAALDPSNFTLPLVGCINQIIAVPGIVSPLQPTPGVACTGGSARNGFTGPNFITFDLGIQKGFPIGEGRMLSFRTEFYNLTNRSNFYNPISVLSTDGVTLNPDFGKIKSAHDPRQIQFAVRFTW